MKTGFASFGLLVLKEAGPQGPVSTCLAYMQLPLQGLHRETVGMSLHSISVKWASSLNFCSDQGAPNPWPLLMVGKEHVGWGIGDLLGLGEKRTCLGSEEPRFLCLFSPVFLIIDGKVGMCLPHCHTLTGSWMENIVHLNRLYPESHLSLTEMMRLGIFIY